MLITSCRQSNLHKTSCSRSKCTTIETSCQELLCKIASIAWSTEGVRRRRHPRGDKNGKVWGIELKLKDINFLLGTMACHPLSRDQSWLSPFKHKGATWNKLDLQVTLKLTSEEQHWGLGVKASGMKWHHFYT